MTDERDRVNENAFRLAFAQALFNPKAVDNFQAVVDKNLEVARDFKLLALPVAEAALLMGTDAERKATQAVIAILTALDDPAKGGLRLNVQRRRTKRHRRSRKHPKLRKLPTRRR